MKVTIAGYNIDNQLIENIKNKNVATPETISAAYARISRSAKTISKLREEAIKEVEKARNSNNTIIFEMGHSSIAEHAVFNLDIIGISRLLSEFIEKSRLASFTEKSQRYVTLKGDYIIPNEIEEFGLKKVFISLVEKQNALYQKLFEELKNIIKTENPDLKKRDLEGKAKEDARYVLSMATQTQIGMTINARSLARLLVRLDKTDLKEASALKNSIEEKIKKIAPSIIRYTKAEDFEKNILNRLPNLDIGKNANDDVNLIFHTENSDDMVLSAMYFEKNGGNFSEILRKISNLRFEEKNTIFDGIFNGIKPYSSMPRAFEAVDYLFQLKMSASCFAQLKRHRMATVIRTYHNKEPEYILPQSFYKTSLLNDVKTLMSETNNFYNRIKKLNSLAAQYILTNAHKVNVLFKMNLRELYHFSRLRCDKHSQWEIRKVAYEMVKAAKKVTPLAGKFLMGKDELIEKNSN